VHFPRTHLFIIIVLSAGLCAFVIARVANTPQQDRFTNESVLLQLPALEETAADVDISGRLTPTTTQMGNTLPKVRAVASSSSALQSTAPPGAAESAPQQKWQKISAKVKHGDNLALIFKRNGLSAKDLHLVSHTKPLGKRLTNIFPGHEITFEIDQNKQLMRLIYSPGPLDTLEYKRSGDGFTAQRITAEPERILAYKHATIDHSLFVASQRADLPDGFTMRLAQIFQWDVDFVLDIRPGDSFYVLFEDLYFNDEFIGYGNILAADFINQGDRYRAIQYIDNDGVRDYFTPTGESMRKAFLRAPVEFSRISSNFNLRRVHPLCKSVRPHRGIDYAAPSGTPILAAGDGKVISASRSQPNGNFVFIQHGEQFETKYLHLSKFGRGIRSGARVKQGQVIGYVGATGWTTAPHLHYEFLVNGVHQNPRTVSLPDAAPIRDNEMLRFKNQTKQFAVLLDNYKNQISVALAR